MHTLVIPLIIVFGFSETKAKMPPAVVPKIIALEQVVQAYQEQRLVWVNIAKGLRPISADCKPTGQSSLSTQILADCLYKIDVAVASISQGEFRWPQLDRMLTQIPSEFNSIREAIELDSKEKQKWLRQQKAKLKEIGHHLFSQMKNRVFIDAKRELEQKSRGKRVEVLCASSNQSVAVYKKLISFYENQVPEYIEFDRLSTQLVYQIWLMDFLKDQCPSELYLAEAKALLRRLDLLAHQRAFIEYRSRTCLKGGGSGEVGLFECLKLPRTPEALSVLARMSEGSRSINSVMSQQGGSL